MVPLWHLAEFDMVLATTNNFKQPESLAEQIAQHIERRIILGELKPKERIQEQKVTKELNVSRGSVREALLILESRHLIDILPRRGAMVSELTEHQIEAVNEFAVHLYVMLAIKISMLWKHEQQFDPFDAVVSRLRSCAQSGDLLEYMDISGEFLDLACELADNSYLANAIHDVQAVLGRINYHMLRYHPEGLSSSVAFFQHMVDGMKKRDVEYLRTELHSHNRNQIDFAIQTWHASMKFDLAQ